MTISSPARLLLALLAVGGATARAQEAPLTTKQLYEQCRDSVVSIEVEGADEDEDAAGTGFFYADDRTVATCFHVIKGAKSIVIKARNGDSWSPVSVSFDAKRDLALLRLGAPSGRKPLPQAPKGSVGVGDPIIVIGDPLGLTGTLSTGVVGGLREEDGVPLVQITAPISHGSSGGPVIDAQGRALGVVSFTMTEGQNVNLAIDTLSAETLLKEEALSMAQFEARSNAASEGSKTPAEDFTKLSKEEAQARLSETMGGFYSEYLRHYIYWLTMWESERTHVTKESVTNFYAAHKIFGESYIREKKWDDALALATRAGVSAKEVQEILDYESVIENAADALLKAEVAVADAADGSTDAQFQAAGKTCLQRWEVLITSISGFLPVVKKRPWFDVMEFSAGMSDATLSLGLLGRFRALPDLDDEDTPTIGVPLEGSKLQTGDIVVGLALDAPKAIFTPVKSWADVAVFYFSYLDEKSFQVKVLRDGVPRIFHAMRD